MAALRYPQTDTPLARFHIRHPDKVEHHGESRVLRGLHGAEDFVAAQGTFSTECRPTGKQGPRVPEGCPARL